MEDCVLKKNVMVGMCLYLTEHTAIECNAWTNGLTISTRYRSLGVVDALFFYLHLMESVVVMSSAQVR